MKVTYTNYPLLLFTSYDKDTAPTELPFEMPDKETAELVAKSEGLHNIFGFISSKNQFDGKNSTTNYYLTNSTFNSVEYDHNFRNNQFRHFFTSYITPRRGCIIFKDGGTYVYNLLSKQETKALYKADGRYMSVAFFIGNVFLGFEECIVGPQGLNVKPGTGIYAGGMDVGGYLSFCIITLCYADGRSKVLNAPDVQETIFEL